MEKRPNRRTHPRYQVDLEAEVRFADRKPHRFRIHNICPGGVLIDCTGAGCPDGLAVGQPCDIRFSLPLDGRQHVLELGAEVAHRAGQGFGARFLHASAAALETLQAFIRHRLKEADAKGSVALRGAALDADAARSLLEKLTLLQLAPLVEGLWQKLEPELWEYSDGLKSDAERNRVVNDLTLLGRAQREQRLLQGMRRALFDPMGRLGGTGARKPAPDDGGGLELVDTERFEGWLARAAMSNRIEETLAEPLRILRNQAATAFGNEPVLPVEPQGLADALGQVLESLGVGSEVQVLCLGSAAHILPPLLGPFYRELIAAWEEAGLVPDPGTGVQPAPQAAGGRSSEPGPAPAAASPARPLSAVRAAELLQMLPADALAPAGWSPPARPLGERMQELLQGVAPETAGLPPEPRLEQRLEVTGQVLGRMLEDGAVPPSLKGWIERLALRFLAAAVAEPGFYGSADHPLPGLIDRLEHLALFSAPGEARIQRELEGLVEQTLAAGGADRPALESASHRLAELEKKYADRFQSNTRRVLERQEGQERLRQARRAVRERLNHTLGNRRIHRSLDVLVREVWQALLQLVYVREGEEGADWRYHWETLVRLRAVCGEEREAGQAIDLAALLARVGEGAAYIGHDPFRRNRIVEQTGRALHRITAGMAGPDDYLEFVPLPAEPDGRQEPSAPPPGVDATEWTQVLARIDGLELGTRLQLGEDPEQPPLYLVWRGAGGAELVFVNPRGLKARTLGRGELALALHRGEAGTRPPAGESVTERARDATLREMQARISYQETHDIVTGLRNQRQLIGALTLILEAEPAAFRPHVLGLVELDHFEAVSGTCGYVAGEKLLVAVAKLLEITLEEATCLAYLGGSRYGLLVPALEEQAGREIGERVRAAMATLPFYWHGTPYPVAGSIGLALVAPACDGPETLLSAATAACRAAQEGGGNRVVLFRENDEGIALQRDRLQWWIRAERAVKEERLRLRAQRIAPAEEDDPCRHHHYEILLSVYDHEGNPLPLGEFIASAEAFNLMAEVDRMVIRKALAWVSDHFGQIERLGGIAINLSGQSLGDAGLVEAIGGQLERLHIPPGLVSFEVTETAAIANLDRAVAIIDGIKALGCRFALDDFGTGMSSYSYLKRLPVDYLKIDGSFVKEILRNPHDRAIVKSINEIAHFMGKQTIAEFVENEAIGRQLREMGVDYLQGYALEKPVFLDEMG